MFARLLCATTMCSMLYAIHYMAGCASPLVFARHPSSPQHPRQQLLCCPDQALSDLCRRNTAPNTPVVVHPPGMRVRMCERVSVLYITHSSSFRASFVSRGFQRKEKKNTRCAGLYQGPIQTVSRLRQDAIAALNSRMETISRVIRAIRRND